MSAAIDDRRQDGLRRRNLRLAIAVALFAVVFYVGMYVVYLTAAR